MHAYANPTRFLRLMGAILPWTAGCSAALLAVGLYFSLLASPADYQQGETVRIMYVHVPSAWMAMFAYAVMAASSAFALVWRHAIAELVCKAVAPIGAGFTAICLISGSLWGEPMWGAWWVWDARLTSVLILFFLYLGYMALVDAFDDPARGLRAGGVLVLVGAINLPIIKFSVDWWNTLHQPASVSRIGVPAVHGSMMLPLVAMSLAFLCIFLTLAILRTRSEVLERRIQTLRMIQASG